ncbi:alpha/beta fold hydrolase [Hoyosella sp. G463]|uniref:Alpha/beta fold hydrolase n=1 Tax=Lolliginicoccus lacisalsi TaxID=2742202 RepID=A0A927JBQ2_9ACTN|nr:alpha/beta fold hydrolase [Lolliginicoccus lacisalsi]
MAENLTIPLPGRTIAAQAWGPIDGPLVLLLHGFPDSPHTWRHLGPRLAERGWRAIAPANRGYAPTGPAPDGNYELAALVRDVLDIQDALAAPGARAPRRALLIGHDWGSMIASGAASLAPDRFHAAILLAVPPLPVLLARAWPPRRLARHARTWLRQAPRSWYMLAAQAPLERVPALSHRFINEIWARWAPAYEYDADLAAAHRALPDAAHCRAALGYYRALWNPLRWRTSRAPERHGIYREHRVPILYLHGERDTCVRADLGASTPDHLPPASKARVVKGLGHFLHLEEPDRVNGAILRFVDGLPGGELDRAGQASQ